MEEDIKKGYALQERIDKAILKYNLEGRRHPGTIVMSEERLRLLILACVWEPYSQGGKKIEWITYRGIAIKTFHEALGPEVELID